MLRLRHRIGRLMVPRALGLHCGEVLLKLLARRIGFPDVLEFDTLDTRVLRAPAQLTPGDAAAPLVGPERVFYFYADERVVAHGHHEGECVMADGGVGPCSGRYRGTEKDSAHADERFADVYEFDGGRIRHRTTYFFRPAI